MAWDSLKKGAGRLKRLVVIAVCVAAMVIAVDAARARGPLDEALPTHPEVLQGQLTNGLTYAVRRHAMPAAPPSSTSS